MVVDAPTGSGLGWSWLRRFGPRLLISVVEPLNFVIVTGLLAVLVT
jgi:hypothetical protein